MDYIHFLELQGFRQCTYKIYVDPQQGAIIIVFFQQRFKAWLKRKKLLRLLQENKMVSTQIEISLSLGVTPWDFGPL